MCVPRAWLQVKNSLNFQKHAYLIVRLTQLTPTRPVNSCRKLILNLKFQINSEQLPYACHFSHLWNPFETLGICIKIYISRKTLTVYT